MNLPKDILTTETFKKCYTRLRKDHGATYPYSIYMRQVKRISSPGLYTISDDRLVYYDGNKLSDIDLEEFYSYVELIAKNKKRARNLNRLF